MIDVVKSDDRSITLRVDLYAEKPENGRRLREIASDGLVTDDELIEIVAMKMKPRDLEAQRDRVSNQRVAALSESLTRPMKHGSAFMHDEKKRFVAIVGIAELISLVALITGVI